MFRKMMLILCGFVLWCSPIVADKAVWVGNRLGMDHSVPIPWTPMQVNKSKVICWGRETDFSGGALPVQITTQRTAILTGPITLKAEVEKDKWQSAEKGTGHSTSRYPDQIVWEGKCALAGIPVKTKVVQEFDGFTWLTLKIGPSAVKVKRLVLEIPVQENVAKFYTKEFEGYAPSLLLDLWGPVKSRKIKMQDFCFANEDVGISFFSEGKLGWKLERRDRQLEWIKDEGQVLVRFGLIDVFTPTAFENERTISLGWNPMPVKPMMKDGRRYVVHTIGGDPKEGLTKEILDTGMTMAGVRLTYYFPEKQLNAMPDNVKKWMNLSYVPIDVPQPYNPEGFKEYMKLFHETGSSKVAIYTVGNDHNVLDPVFMNHFDEWSGSEAVMNEEALAKIRDQEGQLPGCRAVCGWSTFVDYKCWFMVHWFKTLGLDGFYYDNQCFNPCENLKHVAHQFTDDQGKRVTVRPLRNYRDLYKRIYKEIKKIKSDSLLVGHGSSAAYPFVDIAIGGEALQKLAGDTDYYTAFMTAEDCKSPMYSGRQIGIPFLWLPEYRGKYGLGGAESAKSTRAVLSLLWLTDSSYWFAWSNTNVLLDDSKVRGRFKIWEADCYPFWSQEFVNVDKEGVSVSVYKKPKAVLLVASNPGKVKHESLTLSVNTGRLFPGVVGSTIIAKDAETEKRLDTKPLVAVEKSYLDITVSIPDQDFRLIRLEVP